MLNMRPKKKQSTVAGNPGRDINQNNGNCKDYRQKLEEYRKGLYNLNRPENCQHSECGGECIEFDEKGCEICESNRENFRACDMSRGRNHDCPRRDAKESDSGRGFRESQFIRNSMHWEEFFGSSLELAPSLLSIFDSIASANRSPDQDETDQSDHSPRSREDPTNQNQAQELPTIKVDAENCNHSVTMDPCRNDLDTNDNKKRPLSISSMSSTSSSSLPRHTNKRPNLTGKNSNNSLQERMESKLDNILYIDDDVPNGVTDDEMSVDTDCENNKKCEQDSSSNDPQSDKSLSSNDNLSKSDEVRQPLVEVSSNDLDLSNRNEDSINKNSYCNGSSAASTPGSSFYETPDTITTSISSPALQGLGQTPSSSSGTPSRQSSLRDSTSPQKYVSRVQRVVAEIVETERTYVTHLKEIIEGYMKFLVSSNQQYISKKETVCLFGNIEEIYEFSRHFSEELDLCDDDPAKIAQCFVRDNEGFVIYTDYCTNYPSAVEVLTKVMKDPVLSEKFKQQQLSLGHNLPLGAYLLKPVQRVLKYHLLLHNILKNFDKSDPRYTIVSEALDHMTMRAQHMNEMKRKHEHAVRVQEIQSTLEDYEGEDLTRLGELVLEGSFRTYGAKTSRHVFLFEKGVLIAKRKENAMLSCKIFIMCSNLMLVESLPKEPLSFQVIPFDNPKGQHVLMARNMDQKRKWCQEVKRLILESYKGKIPEKVKGLVMQLGKSKTDDSPDTKKFHHLAPDYLERRQRLRRKSGGTLLTDILKPPRMRKAQKRAESVSPRTSPTLTRKFVSPANESPVSMDTKSMDGDESSIGGADDLISRNSTESDLASIVSLGSQADFNQSPKVSIGRSTSFRTAVRSRPLHSESFEDSLPSSPITQSPSSTPTRRSKSFKIATRFKPLIASETTSLPSSPSLPTAKIGFGGNSGSTPDFCDESSDQVFSDELKVRPKHLSLSNSGKFSSMPVLNATEKAQNRKSDVTVSPKLSSGSFNFGNVNQSPKKVIDVRQYFSRNKENNPSISSLTDIEENQNLRKEAKSVSAFHDTFLRKSTENLQKSPKIVRKAITLTRPLSVKNVLNKAYSSDIGRVPPATVEDPWIYNPNVASKENIPRDVHETEKKSQPLGRNRHQRTRSYGGELDDYPNGNFDWIVYANRNSLPVTGLSSEEMRRYQNYYSQSRDASASYQNSIDDMSHERQSETEREQDNVLSFCDDSEPSISKNSYNEDRNQNNVFHTLSNRTLDNELSALGSLPMVNKPPDSCVVQCRKQVKVSRSNSTPCTRPDKYLMFGRHNRTQSVDVTGLNDPDQLLAEMEDYMKRSDSTITLTSQRFPTRFTMPPEDVKEVQEPETNRDSYVSTVSSSSYESQESSDNQESDGIVETLKHKFHDFRKKMYRRSGSYDNKNASGSELDNDSDAEQVKPRNTESKSSLWSLNSWFSPKKESPFPDLSTVLHAGDLGGAGIGSRMADPDPIYAEIGLSQSRYSSDLSSSPTKHNSCVLGTNSVSVSVKAETLPQDYHNGTLDRNLNYQQCDSAFSIDLGGDSSSTSEESPRVVEESPSIACVEQREVPGPPSLKKADSFYEKRLSMAFNDSEFFRDSAVYCDIDLDNQPLSPSTSTPTDVRPPRLPIKEYVQKLEEKHQKKFPETTKVKVREPGEVIKQRLESLQNYSQRRSQSCSRPGSEEREFSRRSSSSSRSVSVDREVGPHRFSLVNFDHNFGEPIGKTKGELFRSYGRENSEPDFRGRSRSRSKSPGGTLKSASSMGRLDQLSTDVENLVIMKGWVKQLIDKFQPSTTDT